MSKDEQAIEAEIQAKGLNAPLFGNTSGKKAGTHWLVFMKPNA